MPSLIIVNHAENEAKQAVITVKATFFLFFIIKEHRKK